MRGGNVVMQNESTTALHAVYERLTELETRMCFQEQTLATLNQALIDAQTEHQRQGHLMVQLLQEMSSVRAMMRADASREPPPPHY